MTEPVPQSLNLLREKVRRNIDVMLGDNLWVRLGIPPTEDAVKDVRLGRPNQEDGPLTGRIISPPEEPHYFLVDTLTLTDPKHDEVTLHNIPVLYCHGIRRDGAWQTLKGQPLTQTVTELNRYADREGLPKVEVILACNPQEEGDRNPLNIEVDDIPISEGAVQIAGDYIDNKLPTYFEDDHTVIMESSSQKIFLGLDALLQKKRISGAASQIEIL